MEESFTTFFNSLNVIPPEMASYSIIGEKSSLTGSSLHELLEKILSDLSCLEQLNMEGAIISRLVYRLKRKIQSDKGYKSLQKINHMLHNYLRINLKSVIEEIKGHIYGKKGPSREILEWGLVSILRFSALFNKIYIICMDGGKYLKERYKSGDFWIAATICFAAVSRIWTLSQHLVKKCNMWYIELKAFLPFLKSCGKQWLPSDFTLPNTINDYLKQPIYLALDEISKKTKSNLGDFGKELSDETSIKTCKSLIITEDIGESISRETGEIIPKKMTRKEEIRAKKLERIKSGNKIMKSRKFKNLKSLNSRESIIDFIVREGVIRNRESNSLTKHLSDEDWKKMKQSVLKHTDHMNNCKTDEEMKERLNRALKCIQYYLFHLDEDTT